MYLSSTNYYSTYMKYFITLLFIFISVKSIGQGNQLETDWANLHRYADENKKLKPHAKGETRVVFIGNSITEQWRLADSNFFIDRQYINRGIGGQTTPQMLVRFRPDVIDLQASVVVILAGINDIAENTGPISLNNIFGNIVSMVQLAKANYIKVVVSSILPANNFPWRPKIKPADKVLELNSMLEAYCKSNDIIYLNYYSKMVDNEKGLEKKLTTDDVHPNLAGYKIMEPLVEEAIQKALSQIK